MAEEHLYLAHHGIKGQRWGVKNGPPYPLEESDKSRSEQVKGGRETTNHSSTTDSANTKKFWTDERKDSAKKIAKGAAIVAGVVLVAYGGYKLSQASGARMDVGKNLIGDILGSSSNVPEPNIPSIEQTLETVNPLRGTPGGRNNCTSCSVATALQQSFGIDACAVSTGGKQQDLVGVVQDCFSDARTLSAGNSRSITSYDDASSFLKRRFGDNASGVIGVSFHGDGGHAFNWSVNDGMVRFYDGQSGVNNDRKYFDRIFSLLVDPERPFDAVRLDNATPKMEHLARYVQIRR